AVSVVAGGFEFEIAVAIADARPAKRLTPDLAAANPHEGLVGRKSVGMLCIVDEELAAVIVAGVTEPLQRLLLEKFFLVAEAAVAQLVGPDVLGEVARRHAWRTGLEHQHFHA